MNKKTIAEIMYPAQVQSGRSEPPEVMEPDLVSSQPENNQEHGVTDYRDSNGNAVMEENRKWVSDFQQVQGNNLPECQIHREYMCYNCSNNNSARCVRIQGSSRSSACRPQSPRGPQQYSSCSTAATAARPSSGAANWPDPGCSLLSCTNTEVSFNHGPMHYEYGPGSSLFLNSQASNATGCCRVEQEMSSPCCCPMLPPRAQRSCRSPSSGPRCCPVSPPQEERCCSRRSPTRAHKPRCRSRRRSPRRCKAPQSNNTGMMSQCPIYLQGPSASAVSSHMDPSLFPFISSSSSPPCGSSSRAFGAPSEGYGFQRSGNESCYPVLTPPNERCYLPSPPSGYCAPTPQPSGYCSPPLPTVPCSTHSFISMEAPEWCPPPSLPPRNNCPSSSQCPIQINSGGAPSSHQAQLLSCHNLPSAGDECQNPCPSCPIPDGWCCGSSPCPLFGPGCCSQPCGLDPCNPCNIGPCSQNYGCNPCSSYSCCGPCSNPCSNPCYNLCLDGCNACNSAYTTPCCGSNCSPCPPITCGPLPLSLCSPCSSNCCPSPSVCCSTSYPTCSGPCGVPGAQLYCGPITTCQTTPCCSQPCCQSNCCDPCTPCRPPGWYVSGYEHVSYYNCLLGYNCTFEMRKTKRIIRRNVRTNCCTELSREVSSPSGGTNAQFGGDDDDDNNGAREENNESKRANNSNSGHSTPAGEDDDADEPIRKECYISNTRCWPPPAAPSCNTWGGVTPRKSVSFTDGVQYRF